MISVRDALARCLATAPAPSSTDIATGDAYGRILAEDVRAASPLPPWNNSAMDGFAVRSEDTQCAPSQGPDSDCCADLVSEEDATGPWLTVIETVAAGQVAQLPVGKGEATRIMTGAPMPNGANAVVMKENTRDADGTVQILQAASEGQNVRYLGENVSEGSIVLRRGHTLSAASIGLASAVGRTHLAVSVQPRVGIISTGDELVQPGTPLGPGQIYSSNTAALIGLVKEAGGIPVDCGVAPDDLNATRDAFERASNCDLIISTGGVSVGDFDVVKEAMADLGAQMQFWKVRMKPGKPLALGMIGGTPAFGLPGNPVSCQVGFLQFVRPWIRRSQGDPAPFLPVIMASLDEPYSKRAGRAEFVRVQLTLQGGEWIATVLNSQSSGSQTSMVQADGLMLIGEDEVSLTQGATVHVQILGTRLGQVEEGYPWP